MKRPFLYVFCLTATLLLFSRIYAQNIRYRGNIKGGFTLTGNTFRYNLIPTDFLNTEAAAGIMRSSAADLVLPPGSKIIKAFLYVEGMSATPITEIKFKVPGAPFQTFNTTSVGFIGNPNAAASYQQFIVDVTKAIPADGYVTTVTPGGDPSGTGRYAVADFDPGPVTNFGYGWSLFVVYTNPTAQYRSVTIADHCSYLSANMPVYLTIDNVVVPVSGPVKAVVALTGSYGDYGPTWSDRIALGVMGGPATYLADPFTGITSDILNSSIAFHAGNNVSADGGPAISGNYTARSPYLFSCPNDPAIHNWSSFYFDADIIDASGILPNSTVPIDVKLTQTLNSVDAIGSGTYALSVDIAAAILSKSINPSFILPGGTATYTFTIANTQPGAINLNNIGFTDNLPSALVIANPASVSVSGTTATVTAAPGGNTVSVAGVSLAAGQTATITVNVTNVPGQLNQNCASNPASFTNGFNNISNVSPNLVNNVSDQCLVVNPTLPPGTLAVTYCQFDIAPPLSATGVNLLWYTTPTGGTGTAVAPVPATTVPGVTTWYVSQTVDGMESSRVPLTVTVTAPMIPLFDSIMVCYGSKPQLLPRVSVNGITGTWNPAVTNTTVTGTHTFTPDAGQCAVPVTLPALVKPVSELSWLLDASIQLSDDTICQGETVVFNNTSRAIHQPVSCLWYFGDGNLANNSSIASHSYMFPGSYKVSFVVSDTMSCRDTVYHTITVDSMPTLFVTLDPDTLCAGESVNFRAIYTHQGNKLLSWNFGDQTYTDHTATTQHAYETAGSYTSKVTAVYRACNDLSQENSIHVYPLPYVYIGPDTSICPNSPPLLLANVQQREAGDRYRWSTGDVTETLKITHDGIYSLLVASKNGCTTKDEIVVKKDCYMDIPNSFTPNGDGRNDYFVPRQLLSSGIMSFSMVVFNRWGEVVFRSEIPEGYGWDGRFNKKEQPLGVYLYQLRVTFKNGQEEHYNGNVTLLR